MIADDIIRSHDCVKRDVIRAETGLGESELGHQLPLPHVSLISTTTKVRGGAYAFDRIKGGASAVVDCAPAFISSPPRIYLIE
jgi:hypothetical protein